MNAETESFPTEELRLEVRNLSTNEAVIHATYRHRKRQGDFNALITSDRADTEAPVITAEQDGAAWLIQVDEQCYRLKGSDSTIE